VEGLPETLNPVLRRVYAARGVQRADELELGLDRLLQADTLLGIEDAVDLLRDALTGDQRIVFVADFDADGATSCAVGMRALRAMGAKSVDYVVPDRFRHGYGLTPSIVELVQARGASLLVTVDNGMSSLEGVAAARAAGIIVLITDHHLPGAELPQANAIVNPNRAGDVFPSKALAGVGVIFYVMLALRRLLRESGWFERCALPEPRLADLLDLVALGTVADVVPLDANNRRLVGQGLARLRAGRGQPGVRALLEVAGRDPDRLVASDLGFAVGPRLNAAGRLSDMSLGIECLLSDDPLRCTAIARELDALNQQRRALERQMQDDALEQVLRELPHTGELPAALCLFDPGWHQGVVGVVAGRVKDRFHRPVIAFAGAGDDELKGSARSIPGVHIRDLLDTLAASHPGLLSRFGGHAMAAGLSLPRAHLEAFRAAFEAVAKAHVDPALLAPEILTDGTLGSNEISLELAQVLQAGGPWGQAFPEPLFEGVFEIRSLRVVGEHHLRLALGLDGTEFEAMAFNASDAPWAHEGQRIRAAYRVALNHWRGREDLQLVVIHAQLSAR
jgi:single-stranded-DNA-specific exonuclease